MRPKFYSLIVEHYAAQHTMSGWVMSLDTGGRFNSE